MQNAEKTHCPKGHAYVESNIYHWRGHRQCLACRNERGRAWRAKNRPPKPRVTPTHCRRGHLFTDALYKDGKRMYCLQCHRDTSGARSHKGHPAYPHVLRKSIKWRHDNPKRCRGYYKNWMEKRAQWYTEHITQLQCIKCGENHRACLDFHHRDRSQKDRVISVALRQFGPAKLEAEMAKCDVLCSNCHRKLHYEEREQQKLKGR